MYYQIFLKCKVLSNLKHKGKKFKLGDEIILTNGLGKKLIVDKIVEKLGEIEKGKKRIKKGKKYNHQVFQKLIYSGKN